MKHDCSFVFYPHCLYFTYNVTGFQIFLVFSMSIKHVVIFFFSYSCSWKQFSLSVITDLNFLPLCCYFCLHYSITDILVTKNFELTSFSGILNLTNFLKHMLSLSLYHVDFLLFCVAQFQIVLHKYFFALSLIEKMQI